MFQSPASRSGPSLESLPDSSNAEARRVRLVVLYLLIKGEHSSNQTYSAILIHTKRVAMTNKSKMITANSPGTGAKAVTASAQNRNAHINV
jgi:hydroxymethylpyrimidine/phosphomethylpyrimidine kinase